MQIGESARDDGWRSVGEVAAGIRNRVIVLRARRDQALARGDAEAGAALHARLVEHETTAWIGEKGHR